MIDLSVLRFVDQHHPKAVSLPGGAVDLVAPEVTLNVSGAQWRWLVGGDYVEELTGPGSGFWAPSDKGYKVLETAA